MGLEQTVLEVVLAPGRLAPMAAAVHLGAEPAVGPVTGSTSIPSTWTFDFGAGRPAAAISRFEGPLVLALGSRAPLLVRGERGFEHVQVAPAVRPGHRVDAWRAG